MTSLSGAFAGEHHVLYSCSTYADCGPLTTAGVAATAGGRLTRFVRVSSGRNEEWPEASILEVQVAYPDMAAACSPHAGCVDTAGSFNCVCNPGYAGDGTTCTDVDECAAHTHNCVGSAAACTNTAGSFQCACNAGYSGTGTVCQDVDECLLNPLSCSAGANTQCVNYVGGSYCVCAPGYNGASWLTCGDINECDLGTHRCDPDWAVCCNTDGSFDCSCVLGYSGDGVVCMNTDECAAETHDCDAQAVCTDAAGSFACLCNAGYLGSGAGADTEILNVPYEGHIYSSTYSGDVNPGTTIRNSGQLYSGSAWASGYNTIGESMQFDLGEMTAVAGVATQGRADLDQWVTSFKVKHSVDEVVWTDVDSGAMFPGNTNRDTLVSNLFAGPVQARYVRIYPQTWNGHMSMRAGVLLQLGCADVEECFSGAHDCNAEAACSNTPGAFTCACSLGFSGDGIVCTDVDECTGNTHSCHTEATCSNTAGAFSCACNAGWESDGTGVLDVAYEGHEYSSVNVGDVAPGSVLQSSGRLDSVSAWVSGALAVGEWMQLDIGEPALVIGVVTKGRYEFDQWVTSFKFKYSVDLAAWIDVDGAANFAGNSNRNTEVSIPFAAPVQARYVRLYPQAWSGYMSMRAGVILQAGCKDIEECSADTHYCAAEATCTNTPGAFTCECNAGYEGDGTACADIDECTSGAHDCHAKATCTNTAGAFTCACNTGWTDTGTACVDVNECTTGAHGCGAVATCSNTVGGFVCLCLAGYAPPDCTEIDECATGAHDCAADATCTNTPGLFTCACNTGYTGPGTACAEVDECAAGTHTCDPADGTCTNTAGSFTCACNAGYFIECPGYDTAPFLLNGAAEVPLVDCPNCRSGVAYTFDGANDYAQYPPVTYGTPLLTSSTSLTLRTKDRG